MWSNDRTECVGLGPTCASKVRSLFSERSKFQFTRAARPVGGATLWDDEDDESKAAPMFGALPTSTVLPAESEYSHTGSPDVALIGLASVSVLVP